VIWLDSKTGWPAAKRIGRPVTIIGIWKEKFKKSRLIGQVCGSAGMIGRKLLKDFGELLNCFRIKVKGGKDRGWEGRLKWEVGPVVVRWSWTITRRKVRKGQIPFLSLRGLLKALLLISG